MSPRCKYAEYDPYFGESFCRKVGKPWPDYLQKMWFLKLVLECAGFFVFEFQKMSEL